MNSSAIKTALLMSTLVLSACSTLQYGQQQPITIYTTPSNATCIIKNDLGSTSIEGTPATGYIYPSKEALSITCNKEGYEPLIVSISSKEKNFGKGLSTNAFIMSNRFAETSRYSYPQKVTLIFMKLKKTS